MKTFVLTLLCLLGIVFPIDARQLVLSRPDGPITEVSERVISRAYKRLGIQVKIKKLPSKRSLIMANYGKVDGVVSRIKGINKTYENLIRVPVAVNMFEGVVFSKNVIFSVMGWDNLKPYIIGIKKGTKFAEIGTKGMKVRSVDTNTQLFLMLDSERVDVIVTARMAGLVALKQLHIPGIQVLEPQLVTRKLYHYLHKKNSYLLPEITRVLQEMESEGRIQEIRTQAITELSM